MDILEYKEQFYFLSRFFTLWNVYALVKDTPTNDSIPNLPHILHITPLEGELLPESILNPETPSNTNPNSASIIQNLPIQRKITANTVTLGKTTTWKW